MALLATHIYTIHGPIDGQVYGGPTTTSIHYRVHGATGGALHGVSGCCQRPSRPTTVAVSVPYWGHTAVCLLVDGITRLRLPSITCHLQACTDPQGLTPFV